MPIELLSEIAHQKLPVVLKDRAQVEQLRVLRDAGHVMALTSPPAARQPFANVLALTREGRNALAQHQQPRTARRA
jgi:hypothetical protein